MPQCEHISCTCEVEDDGKAPYCSEACRESAENAEGGGPTEPHCRCGHDVCTSDVH